MEAWIVIVVLQFALICTIAALELWALHLKEEDQVTFSRLMWKMFEDGRGHESWWLASS